MTEIIFPSDKPTDGNWDRHPMKDEYEAGLLHELSTAGLDDSYNALGRSNRIDAINHFVEEAYSYGMSVYDINRVYESARHAAVRFGGILPHRQYARLRNPDVSVQIWPYPMAAAEAGIFILKPSDEKSAG